MDAKAAWSCCWSRLGIPKSGSQTCVSPMNFTAPGDDYIWLPVNSWLLHWVLGVVSEDVADALLRYIE